MPKVSRWLAITITVTLMTTLVSSAAGATASHQRVPVLGSAKFWPGHLDKGFGRPHPIRIFNGGDPAGLVKQIHWTNWGASRAIGWGRTFIFKPHGGYYPKDVRAKLRVTHLGTCSAHGRPAYRHLDVKKPRKPGGPLGKWRSWSGQKDLCHRAYTP